jgi:hypothetical protein
MELNKILTNIYIYIRVKQTKKNEKKQQKWGKKNLSHKNKSCYLSLRKAPISKPRLAKHKGKGITRVITDEKAH